MQRAWLDCMFGLTLNVRGRGVRVRGVRVPVRAFVCLCVREKLVNTPGSGNR